MASKHAALVRAHYLSVWPNLARDLTCPRGPLSKAAGSDFRELVFAVDDARTAYATSGMSGLDDQGAAELHVFARGSRDLDADIVEVLAATAHYHRTGSPLDVGHTVNFGRPWVPGSTCSFGLVSLPYLDGPALESCDTLSARFLWLIPITEAERDFKRLKGLEALEERFEASGFDYLNPRRPSVV